MGTMKVVIPALLLLFTSVCSAQEVETIISGTAVERTVTIKLADFEIGWVNAPWQPPVRHVILAGSKVRLEAPIRNVKDPVITWHKDRFALPFSGPVLEIPMVSASDAGTYQAHVGERADPKPRIGSDTATLVVTSAPSPLINVSHRAHLNAQNRAVLSGFVIDQAGGTSLLVRAIGPALGKFGIADPLAQPRLRVINAQGIAMTPLFYVNHSPVVVITPPDVPDDRTPVSYPEGSKPTVPRVPDIPGRLGAFPLPADSADIEYMYHLNPGIYTAEVTSGDGSSGTVLLEIYQYR